MQTRLRYNPKTKEHFIDEVIKVPKMSEKKRGIAVFRGTDMGNTSFCTFLSPEVWRNTLMKMFCLQMGVTICCSERQTHDLNVVQSSRHERHRRNNILSALYHDIASIRTHLRDQIDTYVLNLEPSFLNIKIPKPSTYLHNSPRIPSPC